MPYIAPAVSEDDLSRTLKRYLGNPIHKGKVRDTYALPGTTMFVLVVATDRVSIFDFVLGSLIPDKGAVLTATNVLWFVSVFSDLKQRHHLQAFGRHIDVHLPSPLCNNAELQKRALVVRRLSMVPVECVVRGYLTGSGLKEYEAKGSICGEPLPEGLYDGSKLPKPIFTPTTKADVGHDVSIDARWVDERYPGLRDMSIEIFERGTAYAAKRGLIIADTKFEFGLNGSAQRYVLADEVFTPDSSRFWLKEAWKRESAKLRSPQGYDKQIVREWGKNVGPGINTLDPTVERHAQQVGDIKVPVHIRKYTTDRYRELFEMLAGMELEEFQKNFMQIREPESALAAAQ